MRRPDPALLLAAFATLAAPAPAQPNAVPGLDVACSNIGGIAALARSGAYPNGVNGLAFTTTCCNPGSVVVTFSAAMNANHPFIGFLVARESGGRFVQISDWSYLKHAFTSTNFSGACGPPCAATGGGNLAVGCFDTYGTGLNGDHYWLGPPSEINPWTGAWAPACSHFDRGEPPVAPAQQCDSARSLTATQAAALNAGVNHRIRVADADLAVPGASFWYQGMYVVIGEAEAKRDDPAFPLGSNLAAQSFSPSWNGSSWSLADGAGPFPGSILKRWTGATVTSAANGAAASPDDGRVYCAVKVTGPNALGLYHYEYAFQNRDNIRGVSAFRIPICAQASASGAGFRDIDANAANDWTFARNPGELVWSSASNPLLWNTIFNVWFDSDAAPDGGLPVTLDAFLAGPGASQFDIPATASPTGIFTVDLGPGCGVPVVPELNPTGTPPRATLGNASFGLYAFGNAPGSACGLSFSVVPGVFPLAPGCSLYTADPASLFPPIPAAANFLGIAGWPLPVPNDPALEGVDLDFQSISLVPGGAFLGAANLSNGLRIRVGTSIAGCP